MIDSLKKISNNLSDKADDLLAINVETYNLLHDFNVNGTGFLAADGSVFGATLDTVRIIDTSYLTSPATTYIGGNSAVTARVTAMRPKFYDSSNIICGYGNIGGGFSMSYWNTATHYKLFNLSSLTLDSEKTTVSDGIICPLKTAANCVDVYTTASEAAMQLKIKDTSMASLSTVNISGLTRAETLFYSTNKPNKYLGHWAGTDDGDAIVTIAFLTRAAEDEAIMLRQYVTDLSGTEVADTSTKIPFTVWGSSGRYSETIFDFGQEQKQSLNQYLQIFGMYDGYLLCIKSQFGKRFLCVYEVSSGDLIYIDSDMFFLYGALFARYAGYGVSFSQDWAQIGGDLDGQVLGQISPGTPFSQSNVSSIIADFMVTPGYVHFIVRNYGGIYYYLRFHWEVGT
jgi:hypothetical protein